MRTLPRPSPSSGSASRDRDATHAAAIVVTVGAIVGTSIAPRIIRADRRGREIGAAIQRASLASLADAFGRVRAYNFDEEIAALGAQYPAVEMVGLGPKPLHGRPLVSMGAVVSDLLRQEGDLFALANADVLIHADRASLARVCEAARHGLVLFSRTETDDLARGRGPVYRAGFDLFVCHRSTLEAVALDGLAFGMPWWDYALPALCVLKGIPLFRGEAALLRHYTHAVAWSPELWRTGLLAYLSLLEAATDGAGNGADFLLNELAATLRRFAEPRSLTPLHGGDQIFRIATVFSLYNVAMIDRAAVTL